jgi:hypothetical protein
MNPEHKPDLMSTLRHAYRAARDKEDVKKMDLVLRAMMYANGGERKMAEDLIREFQLD